MLGLKESSYLKKRGVNLHHQSQIIPWHQTRFAETVKKNKSMQVIPLTKRESEPGLKANHSKNSESKNGRKL